MCTYSASKAAALAVTRSLRAELGSQNINISLAMPVRSIPRWGLVQWRKVAPEEAAIGILDAVEAGKVEASRAVAVTWLPRSGPIRKRCRHSWRSLSPRLVAARQCQPSVAEKLSPGRKLSVEE